MSLNPALAAMVTAAAARYQAGLGPVTGIVPLGTLPELDLHDAAISMVAGMINDALTGPAIGIYELAEVTSPEVV